MKVQIVANILPGSSLYDGHAEPGQELDVSEEIGNDLITRALAIKLSEAEEKAEGKPKGEVERAVADKRETAVGPGQKK